MVQIGPDWFQEGQIGPDWPQEAQIGPDWSQEAQIGPDWSQELQIGPDWPPRRSDWLGLLQEAQIGPRMGKIGHKRSTYMDIHKYIDIQSCIHPTVPRT